MRWLFILILVQQTSACSTDSDDAALGVCCPASTAPCIIECVGQMCKNKDIICPAGGCELTCASDGACDGTELACHESSKCAVVCKTGGACKDLNVFTSTGKGILSLSCLTANSCTGAKVACGDLCDIGCSTPLSCKGLSVMQGYKTILNCKTTSCEGLTFQCTSTDTCSVDCSGCRATCTSTTCEAPELMCTEDPDSLSCQATLINRTTDAPATRPPDTAEPTKAPDTRPPPTDAPDTPAPPTDAPDTPAPPTATPTDAPDTPAPPTDAPDTPAPPTDAPDTPAPPTDAPDTPAPPTDAPDTPAPPTDAPDTPAPPTAPPTDAPDTRAPPTDAPDTPAPPTDAPDTPAPPTAPPTDAPDTRAPPTDAPDTPAPPTDAPDTRAPPTDAPDTPAPPTDAPDTPAPPTAPPTDAPDTRAPVTDAPDTRAPPTDAPDTPAPPTAPPTDAPNTPAPPTDAPDTPAPPTDAPDTPAPPTDAPDTPAPPTAPPTEAPDTPAPPTDTPDTLAPPTDAPDTPAPPTDAPDTPAPPTDAPDTRAPPTVPPTDAPDTPAPPTDAPETRAPPTDAPPTDAPDTPAPPTDAPDTPAPPTVPPTEVPDTRAPPTDAPDTPAPPTEAPDTKAPDTPNPTPTPSDAPDTPAPPTEAPTLTPTAAPDTKDDQEVVVLGKQDTVSGGSMRSGLKLVVQIASDAFVKMEYTLALNVTNVRAGTALQAEDILVTTNVAQRASPHGLAAMYEKDPSVLKATWNSERKIEVLIAGKSEFRADQDEVVTFTLQPTVFSSKEKYNEACVQNNECTRSIVIHQDVPRLALGLAQDLLSDAPVVSLAALVVSLVTNTPLGANAGTKLSRASILLTAIQCPSNAPRRMDRTLYPLQVALGDGQYGEYLGAVVYNILLALCLVPFCAVWYAWLYRKWLLRCKEHEMHSIAGSGIVPVSEHNMTLMHTARFGLLPLPAVFLFGGIVTGVATVLMHEDSGLKVIGGIGCVVVAVLPVYMVMVIKSMLVQTRFRRRRWNCGLNISERRMAWDDFWLGSHEWGPEQCTVEHISWMALHSLCFQQYKPTARYFLVMELILLAMLAVVAAWSPREWELCMARVVLMGALSLSMFLAIVVIRPYIRMYENIAEAGVVLCEVITMLFTILAMGDAPRDTQHWAVPVAEKTGQSLVVLNAVKLILDFAAYTARYKNRTPAVLGGNGATVISDEEERYKAEDEYETYLRRQVAVGILDSNWAIGEGPRTPIEVLSPPVRIEDGLNDVEMSSVRENCLPPLNLRIKLDPASLLPRPTHWDINTNRLYVWMKASLPGFRQQ